MSARRAAGFTLIEVLGVLLVMTLLLGVAVDFYINLSRQTERASEHTRSIRLAASLLDRIARDLEQTLLVRKPAELDPLAHPWLFLAEPRLGQAGSDHLMFVRREPPRASDGPGSDLALVAYTLDPSEDGRSFALRRWSTPELPESLDREFPAPDDPASLLVADGITHFAARFLDESGQWVDRWDSSQLLDSSELPVAVELAVALADPRAADGPTGLGEEPVPWRRVVPLPLRPIDLEALLQPEEEEQGGPGEGEDVAAALEGKTIADCVDLAQLPADLRDVYLSRAADTPYSIYASAIQSAYPAAVRPGCRQ